MSRGGGVGDGPHLRLLDSLRPLPLSANEAGVVARLASFSDSRRLLEAIADTDKWYGHWDIRDALLRNPHSPEAVRRPIGRSVAVLSMVREMAMPGLSGDEREELREDIRSLIQTLPARDADLVKQRTRQLVGGSAQVGRAPATEVVPTPGRSEESYTYEAATTHALPVLRQALLDRRARVRRAALDNPRLEVEVLLEALAVGPAQLLAEVGATPRWTMLDAVRRHLLESDATPATTRATLEATAAAMTGMYRYFNEPMDVADRRDLGKRLLGEIHALPTLEREVLKIRMGSGWSAFLAEVTAALTSDVTTPDLAPVPTGSSPPTPPTPPNPNPNPNPNPTPASQARKPTRDSDPDASGESAPAELPHEVSGSTRASLARLPLEQRLMIAGTTANRDELGFLLFDPDDRVFAALLSNPHVGEAELAGVVRKASADRVRKLVGRGSIYARLGIKRALLQNPTAPASIQLECLDHIGDLFQLLEVIRDPRIGALEVKSKARARLLERYRAMTATERVVALRKGGDDLLHQLWQDAMSDEPTLHKLVADPSLDERLVLHIARSRIAPRAVLGTIARTPTFTASYQVRLELVQNPKTPREALTRLIQQLNPADRQRLKKSGDVARYVREIA